MQGIGSIGAACAFGGIDLGVGTFVRATGNFVPSLSFGGSTDASTSAVPLGQWEDHTVETTVDDITIRIQTSKTSGDTNAKAANDASVVIHEIVTTTRDSLYGTQQHTSIIGGKPTDGTASLTDSQLAAIAAGRSSISSDVDVTDKRTVTRTTFATNLAHSSGVPGLSIEHDITTAIVDSETQHFSLNQSASYDAHDPQQPNSAEAVLQSLQAQVASQDGLSKLLRVQFLAQNIVQTSA
ncbi:MAG: hypothetical protein JO322_12990 [Candidatus Eremiobacteraeota bacterium]|nr:hypothetical protein [Candidatus Eremiobacteraeota bacterium]